jgi:hypothetical protein
MAGDIFPKNGHPVYLPPERQLPEAASPEEAQQMAQQYMKMGFDGIKLFTGSFMGAKPTANMDTAIVKAAVDVAHAQGWSSLIRRIELEWTMLWRAASIYWRIRFPLKANTRRKNWHARSGSTRH